LYNRMYRVHHMVNGERLPLPYTGLLCVLFILLLRSAYIIHYQYNQLNTRIALFQSNESNTTLYIALLLYGQIPIYTMLINTISYESGF